MCLLLILDDDPIFCEVVRTSLERSARHLNLAIHTATAATQAVELVRAAVRARQPFDILLIDQRLDPDDDGIEVLVQLRQISPESDAIVFTGLDDPASGQRAYEAGAFRYLPRLFDARELVYLLQSLIDWRKVNSERDRLKILNEIGRQVTSRAVQEDLGVLLDEVRHQIGRRLDVANFIVALIDTETNQLDFRLHYDHGLQLERHYLPLNKGMTGHLVSLNQVLYLPTGDETYCRETGIQVYGEPSRCWVGIPLRFENRVIAAMVMQNYEQEYAYTGADVQFLVAVAGQISSAIQATRMAEQEHLKAQSLSILPRASAEMLKWANQNEDHLWYILLSIATANWGFRFNRCWLFLANPTRTQLAGRLGIGNIDAVTAHFDWEHDEQDRMTFDTFLAKLSGERLRRTPLEHMTPQVSFDLNGSQDAISQVVFSGQRQVIPTEVVRTALPAVFVNQFDPSQCAILPVRAANEIIGVALVDNRFDGKPIDLAALDHLETFLNMAGLVWDNLHHRKAHDALLDATYAIMGEVGGRSMKSTLEQICSAALTVTGAGWAIIYPCKPGSEGYEYDIRNISFAGSNLRLTEKDKARPRGVTAHILRTGKLVIPNLSKSSLMIGDAPLNEHPFLLRYHLQAFIGLPVRAAGAAEQLGVMYLNYTSVRVFSEDDVRRAESFANLAAIAIQNGRHAEQIDKEIADARQRGQASQRELEIYQQILQAALLTPDQHDIVKALLDAIPRVVNQDLLAIIALHGWRSSEQGEMVEDYQAYSSKPVSAPLDSRATGFSKQLAQRAMQRGQSVLSPSKRQLYVPVRMPAHSSGVIYIRQNRAAVVTDSQQSALERLASIAALALDGVQRQQHLRGVLEAARMVTTPIGLKGTLDAIIRSVHQMLPDIAALTLWYFDPESGTMKVGPCFGVRNTVLLEDKSPEESSVVWEVMHHSKPIYAEDASQHRVLVNKFIQREGIISVAAFPLVADLKSVGAMFFNYRLPHHFNHEERLLFPLLVEIVAASISDAIQLESLRKQREQLDAALVVAEAAGASVDINQIIHTVLSELHNLLGKTSTAPCLLLYNEDEQALEFAPPSSDFYHIDNSLYASLKRLPLDDQAIACRVARRSLAERRPVNINISDTRKEPDYLDLITTSRSELCASLVSGERLLGVLVLESPQVGAFDQDDVRLVEGIAQQITIAIERARQSDERRFTNTVAAATAWAAEIAHNINREIGQIRNYAYWIKEEYEQRDRVENYCTAIDESAGRLALRGAWGNLEPVTFALDQSVEQMLNSAIDQRDNTTRLIFHPGCKDVLIQTSKEQFERVLRQLSRNSMAAMQHQEEKTITATTRLLDENTVEIIIEDNGPGIDESIHSSIFQKPVNTKGGQGGFGLMFVRQMVVGMGGKIRLLPQAAGGGASFSIRLPLVSPVWEGAA
ncbi:MAG TPA: GAF domain-containing protein [Levilinea sp.]|nr:GAF domain-containing protein [Levilinea sp.]